MYPGLGGEQSHFVDAPRPRTSAEIAVRCRGGFWLWLVVEQRPPTGTTYSHRTPEKMQRLFSVVTHS